MSDISVLNTTADLSAKTLVTAEGDRTITGNFTFNRSPSAPLTVQAGSAMVANLDADKLHGKLDSAFGQMAVAATWTTAQQFPSGTVAAPGVAVGATGTGVYSSGANALDFTANGIKALGITAAQFLNSPTQPRAVSFNSAVQSLANATETALTFDTDTLNVGALHNTGLNSSRMTVPTGGDGLYVLIGWGAPQSAASGNAYVYLRKNGTTALGTASRWTLINGSTAPNFTLALAALVATDYVEVLGFQNSGGALNFGDNSLRPFQNQFIALKLW